MTLIANAFRFAASKFQEIILRFPLAVFCIVTPEAQRRAMDLTHTMAIDVEYWPTPDPTAAAGSRDQMLDAYRQVRDRLMAKIKQRFGPFAPPRGEDLGRIFRLTLGSYSYIRSLV